MRVDQFLSAMSPWIYGNRVPDGPFQTAEEPLRKTLDTADECSRLVRAAIDEGVAQLDCGEGVDGEEVFERLDAKLATAEKDDSRIVDLVED